MGFTLEWATTSPPPAENFLTLPEIKSRRPVWDADHPELADWKVAKTPEDSGTRPGRAHTAAWAFVVSEAIFFALLLVTYVVFNTGAQPAGPTAATALDTHRTGLFTLFLLASSVTFWIAERSLRSGAVGRSIRWLAITILLGVIFLCGQAWEYTDLISDGVTISRNLFAATFFTVTGFHGLHVTAGVVALAIMLLMARGPISHLRAGRCAGRGGDLLALRRCGLDRRVFHRLSGVPAVITIVASSLWNIDSPVWLVALVIFCAHATLVRDAGLQQRVALACGLVVLVLAFVSPLGTLADGYLFTAHMVQHLLLLLIVPLCLLLSLPRSTVERWLARPPLDRIGRTASGALACWIAGVGAMWFWHVPALCNAATLSPLVGGVRDTSFVLAGLAFWWPVYAPVDRCRLHPLSGVTYLFSACLGCTLLGIYITFTTVTVCPAFASPVDRLGVMTRLYEIGLTPRVDQSLGGLVMWVPPCTLYVCAIIGLLCRWYSGSDAPPEVAPTAGPAARNGPPFEGKLAT